jgi:hypothetical protein
VSERYAIGFTAAVPIVRGSRFTAAGAADTGFVPLNVAVSVALPELVAGNAALRPTPLAIVGSVSCAACEPTSVLCVVCAGAVVGAAVGGAEVVPPELVGGTLLLPPPPPQATRSALASTSAIGARRRNCGKATPQNDEARDERGPVLLYRQMLARRLARRYLAARTAL